LIAAARPNFMKIAPLYHAMARESWCRPSIVHTGQHYDHNMSDAFFQDPRLPTPHFHLEVGIGSHAQQTGNVTLYRPSNVDSRESLAGLASAPSAEAQDPLRSPRPMA